MVFETDNFGEVVVALGAEENAPQSRCIKGTLHWHPQHGFIVTGVESNSAGAPKFFKASLTSVDVFPKSASCCHIRGVQKVENRFYCDVCLQFQGALKTSKEFADRMEASSAFSDMFEVASERI